MFLLSHCQHKEFIDMYNNEDFKRLFIRYKDEKWYKSIRLCAVKGCKSESFRNFIIYKFVNVPKYSYL